MPAKKEIVILGSTGSIGVQALEIIAANPEKFKVVGLAAGGKNSELLKAQASQFGVKEVGEGVKAATDIAAIKTAMETVAQASQAVGAAMYQEQAQAANTNQEGATSENNNEDIVDAEIVDEGANNK